MNSGVLSADFDALRANSLALRANLDALLVNRRANTDSFHYKDFQYNLDKFVQLQHVQTSEHWLQEEMIPNKLNM